MAKLVHYRNKCIGCGICQELQPGTWRMSKKDGKAVLLHAEQKKDLFLLSIPSSELSLARQTIAACPARVIKLMGSSS